MGTGKRKPPTATQKADARRLREIWDKKMEGADKATQESFADRYGIGTQGAVWQYLGGYIPLNIFAAAKFAKGLDCSIDDFSPTLAEQIRELIPQLRDAPVQALKTEQQDMLEAMENAPPDAKKVIKLAYSAFIPKRRRGARGEKE